MLKHFVAPTVLLAALTFSPVTRAQGGQPAQQGAGNNQQGAASAAGENQNIHLDGWDRPAVSLEATGKKPGPAPVHDLSGIWEPVPGYRDGVFAAARRICLAMRSMRPSCLTRPLGKQTMASHKAGFWINIAPISQINDPFDNCDPIGFPRIELFNLRAVQIVQTKDQVLMLYQNTRTWRNIWTDGRPLPKLERYPSHGGSDTRLASGWTIPRSWLRPTGLDDSTWIDNIGRPHSDELVVEETFHRVDELTFELA